MTPRTLKLICASTLILLSASYCSTAQTSEWPKTINTATGTIINLYSPQILAFSGDSVQSRSVISVQGAPDGEPVFGVAWTTARVVADTAMKRLTIEAVRVDRLSIPADNNKEDQEMISFAIAVNIPRVVKTMMLTDVQSSLQLGLKEAELAKDEGAVSPKVYFSTEPTALVLIDGEPVLVRNERWGLNFVKNTRNVILQDKDGKFYLYGAGYWYVAPSATGPYAPAVQGISRTLRKIERDLTKAARKADVPYFDTEVGMKNIIVSTAPAVLVQSNGDPDAVAISQGAIFYVRNSDDAIYYDTSSKQFYVNAAGNWFQSNSLHNINSWHLIGRVDLPAELLVSLNESNAGEAVMEQQVPQTARVERTITTSVDYDGAPRFAPIEGTELEYATNTCSIVFKYNDAYYALDNGIWFIAGSPLGAWRVSDVRPEGVESIPRRYRVYRAKFVYVYQTTSTAVYEGYLPGYEEAPMDGCGMAVAYDQDWSDMAWSYDLDYVFDWGFGLLCGYYRFDPWNRYYGYMVYEGSHPGWRSKARGPGTKNGVIVPGGGGSGSGGGYASRGVGPHGKPPVGPVPNNGVSLRPGPPHPPGGWGQRTPTTGYSGVVFTMPNRAGSAQISGGASGTGGGLRSLPANGSPVNVGASGGTQRGFSGGGAAPRVAGGYSGGGTVSHGGGYSGGGAAAPRSGGGNSGGGAPSGNSGGGGHVSSGGGGGSGSSGGGGGGAAHAPSGGGGAQTHH